jgi:hypothetical protein
MALFLFLMLAYDLYQFSRRLTAVVGFSDGKAFLDKEDHHVNG